MWSKSTNRLDWVVVVATMALSALSILTMSVPVVATGDLLLFYVLWPVVAVLWVLGLRARAEDLTSRLAIGFLLVGFAVCMGGIVPFMVLVLTGPGGFAIAASVTVALFGIVLIRAPRRPLVWLVAPAIVLATAAVIVLNVPSRVRLALADQALTEFAQKIERGDPVTMPTDAGQIVIGSISVFDAQVDDGVVHLVTAYVGILGDYRAGLAYAPAGLPADGGRYEHLSGSWYRWFGFR